MTHTNFKVFKKNSLAVMVEVVDLAVRAVIDSFKGSAHFRRKKGYYFMNFFDRFIL